MIASTVPGGEICTVIDEGLLNTETGADVRKFILQQCRVKAILNLPSETFKPNKINVRSSVLYLEKRDVPDIDFDDHYPISFCRIDSLGYLGSGDIIRGFDIDKLCSEVATKVLNTAGGSPRSGYHWIAYDVDAVIVGKSPNSRLDYKYWDINIRNRIDDLIAKGYPTLNDINQIITSRGQSPSTDSYVDQEEGFAVVIKAGSSISRFGTLVLEGSDWIEKSTYDEYVEKAQTANSNLNLIQKGDVLLSSTGDGTLGKACVYDAEYPAVADGHVTIIRVDSTKIDPFYLADYLRYGFGADQITRLFTGSTGLIELTPEQVDCIVVEFPDSLENQRNKSMEIRNLEKQYAEMISGAQELLIRAQKVIT